jgi:hypothetical protein
MNTIFNLKQDAETDLDSSNHNIFGSNLRQVTASRSIEAKSFSSGVQNFKFEMSGNKWWRPSHSYLRVRCSLTRANPVTPGTPGDPLSLSDNIAPAMGLCGNLYQNMDFKMGDTTISRISNNVAQIDTLKHRTEKSQSWSKSIGSSTNFWNESFSVRQNEVCSNGVHHDRVSEELKRSDFAIYNVATTVAYVNGTNTAAIVYSAPPPADTWKAGDLYTDYTNGNVEAKQLITAVALTANTFVIHLSQFPAVNTVAASAANKWSRTRITGSSARRVSSFECCWQPPLSIFDYDAALPCGKYELSMLPFSDAQLQMHAIESIGANTKTAADFHFEVSEVYLVIEELEGPNCTDMKYLLDLSQLRVQENTFAVSSFGQKTFDVSPGTRALTIAYQDGRISSDTRISASKFKVYDDVVPVDAATNTAADFGLTLERQYVSYAGHNYPPQDSQPEFKTNVDRTTQRYVESLMQSNAYHDTGGGETIEDFHSAGSYYLQKIYKDKSDGATRAVVYSGFSNQTKHNNARTLLFDEHGIVVAVNISNGQIKEVRVEEI